MFQKLLLLTGKVRNASDADISVIFPQFFLSWVTRSDIGLHDLKHLRKGIVESMMRVLRRSGLRPVSLSPCFRGGVWGEKCCWYRCSSILAFQTSS